MGHAGVFAFYPNKQITTGEGGVVVTQDEALARRIRALRNQGRYETDDWLQHSELGYNYRISEINCALGLAQMSRLEEILRKRAAVAAAYRSAARAMSRADPAAACSCRRPDQLVCLCRAPGVEPRSRDAIMRGLAAAGIASAAATLPPSICSPVTLRGELPRICRLPRQKLRAPSPCLSLTTWKRRRIDEVCTTLSHLLDSVNAASRCLRQRLKRLRAAPEAIFNGNPMFYSRGWILSRWISSEPVRSRMRLQALISPSYRPCRNFFFVRLCFCRQPWALRT